MSLWSSGKVGLGDLEHGLSAGCRQRLCMIAHLVDGTENALRKWINKEPVTTGAEGPRSPSMAAIGSGSEEYVVRERWCEDARVESGSSWLHSGS